MIPLPDRFWPQRILIIKPSSIGDVVHALPVLARVRRRFPAAKLSWLVTPACAALVQRHPLVDEVILFQKRRRQRWRFSPWRLLDVASFLLEMHAARFDLVIDLQGLLRSGITGWATAAPAIVGFANAREGAPLFYTHRVECSWERDHAIERYLKITTALGCPDGPVEFLFAVDDDDRRHIAGLVPRGLRYAALIPGSNWATKRWPAEKFAALVPLLKTRLGLESVVAGSAADATLAAKIPAAYDLTGKTDLRQMVALLERADLVIANDSGPMHIAAALGRPLVSAYGPTSPTRTGPFARLDSVIHLDIPCSPCYYRTCCHQSCLQWLQIEPVLQLAQEQIEKYGKQTPAE